MGPGAAAVETDRQAVARRWKAIDPLLPEPSEPAKTCGTDLTVTSADGRIVATGFCRHVHLRPGSLELAWGAASQFVLTAWVVGPDVGDGLGQLLERWRRHLLRQQDAADEDSSAMTRWPSRDVNGVRVLLEHGMRPLTVVAARPADRAGGGSTLPAGSADLRIRMAGQGDLDVLERLGMEMMRYDAHFGSVTVRADTACGLRESAARTLAAARPWIWLAERDGEAVGMVQAEPPEAAGAAVTLLHHAQLNPLSAPFWNRMGYRPLWTLWEVRPANRLSSPNCEHGAVDEEQPRTSAHVWRMKSCYL